MAKPLLLGSGYFESLLGGQSVFALAVSCTGVVTTISLLSTRNAERNAPA
jgi:hypothetical protein